MSGAVNKTLVAEGVEDIIDFNFIPWGNAYYNTSKCGTSSFDKMNGMYCWIKRCGQAAPTPDPDCFEGKKMCQHGQAECQADTLEACAVALYPDFRQHMPFVYCFEGKHHSSAAYSQQCAEQAGLDHTKLQACANGQLGAQFDAANAKRTADFGPSRLGTPWLVVNGQALDDPGTLLDAVCGAYAGAKPAGCAGAALARTD